MLLGSSRNVVLSYSCRVTVEGCGSAGNINGGDGGKQ